jgi:hypothetical protein
MNVDHEVSLLQKEIVKHGKKQADGSYIVKYGRERAVEEQ